MRSDDYVKILEELKEELTSTPLGSRDTLELDKWLIAMELQVDILCRLEELVQK